MAKETIWIEKTKFHNTLSLMEEYIEDIEDEMRVLRKLVNKFKDSIIYKEKI